MLSEPKQNTHVSDSDSDSDSDSEVMFTSPVQYNDLHDHSQVGPGKLCLGAHAQARYTVVCLCVCVCVCVRAHALKDQ